MKPHLTQVMYVCTLPGLKQMIPQNNSWLLQVSQSHFYEGTFGIWQLQDSLCRDRIAPS